MPDKYRVSSSNEAAVDHDTYAEAAEHFVRKVNDPACGWVDLWEIAGESNSAMELGKFSRTR